MIIRFLVAASMCAIAAYAYALEPVRGGQEASLSRIAFTDGRLWLLNDSGQLFSLAETDARPRKETLPEPVLDMCVHEKKLTLLTGRNESAGLSLMEPSGSQWMKIAKIPADKSYFAGLHCDTDSVLVVRDNTITKLSPQLSALNLSNHLPYGLRTSHSEGHFLYVGANAGEWGGGISRVDLITGETKPLGPPQEQFPSCDGYLNAQCEPVNGITTLPWRKDCLAVATGLRHMSLRKGRIYRVCGEQINIFYEKPLPEANDSGTINLVSFYGLLPMGDRLLAVGENGLYRISADTTAERIVFPDFKKVGPFRVAFTNDLVFVYSEINQRHSAGGDGLLVVTR